MFNTLYAETLLEPFHDPETNRIDIAALESWLQTPACDLSLDERITLAEWASDHNTATAWGTGRIRGQWLRRFVVVVALLAGLLATLAPVAVLI